MAIAVISYVLAVLEYLFEVAIKGFMMIFYLIFCFNFIE